LTTASQGLTSAASATSKSSAETVQSAAGTSVTTAQDTTAPSTSTPTGSPTNSAATENPTSSGNDTTDASSGPTGSNAISFTNAEQGTKTTATLGVAGNVTADEAETALSAGLGISVDRFEVNNCTYYPAKRQGHTQVDFTVTDPAGSTVSSYDILRQLEYAIQNNPEAFGSNFTPLSLDVLTVNAQVESSSVNSAGNLAVSAAVVLGSLLFVLA